MAVYRQVHTTFWQDPFVLDALDFKEKYFYLYLMTNSKTTQCGIYEISEGVMKLETGLSMQDISGMLQKLEAHNKIKFNKVTKEIMLINWIKYNPVNNTNIEKCVLRELREIKSESFRINFIKACITLQFKIPLINKAYEGLIRGLHTPTKKEEEEKEEEQQQEIVTVIGNVFQEYEKCGFGLASSVQAEMLMDFEKTYGYEMTVDALKESAKNNVLKLSYAEGILKNWKVNGRRNKVEPGGQNKESTEQPRRKYGKQRTDEELDAIDVNDPSII